MKEAVLIVFVALVSIFLNIEMTHIKYTLHIAFQRMQMNYSETFSGTVRFFLSLKYCATAALLGHDL